ncbi:MAG: cation:proton antiporter [Mycobacterium sp.]
MNDTGHYAVIILFASAVGLVALMANRLTERVKVPVPFLVLAGAALASRLVPSMPIPPEPTVERIITIALVVVLFDGGMHIGWSRFRESAAPILALGIVGTFLTTAGAAIVLHAGFGIDWYLAVLVATAVAPTDPAVVFSVLGKREVAGRSGTILEGESGANDPVGIALMSSLLAAGGLTAAGFATVGAEFLRQMLIGGAIGILGGRITVTFIRRVSLPSEGLYPLRTLAVSLMLYGLTTLAHGSGFLAVFIAGIVVGDARAPYKPEIARFHGALAGLAEIVAFAVLGLTVDLRIITQADVWVPGLVLGVAIMLVVRPLAVGACLVPARLRTNERIFIMIAGLKGLVPILLGEFLRAAQVPQAERLYGIVVVVVAFSVLVQGSSLPAFARMLHLPMRTHTPEPWALSVRLRDEPSGVHRLTVASGSTADGSTVEELGSPVAGIWVSIVVRGRRLVPVRADTRLRAGDEVVVLADPDTGQALGAMFGPPGDTKR